MPACPPCSPLPTHSDAREYLWRARGGRGAGRGARAALARAAGGYHDTIMEGPLRAGVDRGRKTGSAPPHPTQRGPRRARGP
jgi:hypothetical protein